MAKYKIGITERGDASKDFSWVQKLDSVDGAIVITKCISPEFTEAVLANKDKLIVHATCTGYGGTVLEPNVPDFNTNLKAVMGLVNAGFPQQKVTIRVDPIIPTEKGLKRAQQVIEASMEAGFNRYRMSLIDMYSHVRARFKNAGLPCPYGNAYAPGKKHLAATDEMLCKAQRTWVGLGHRLDDLRIESCAEPGLTVPMACGCISGYDLSLLGLNPNTADSAGHQRKACMCYSGKTELLSVKSPCQHQCLYCYWTSTK